MSRFHSTLLFILIPILYFDFVFSLEFKLSDSKLLLPYNSYSTVNYTLTVSDKACYTWTSSSNDVVSVTPVIFPSDKAGEDSLPVVSPRIADCSHAAVVTAVWQAEQRATAFVQAHNKVTGHVVKCDVIVDKIHHLEIETTTQELYLHDAPESLVARAYDEAGNTFSSLVGIPFDWQIKLHSSSLTKSSNDLSSNMNDGGVLRFITWTESEYTPPKHIEYLENLGLQGFMQLVIGLKSGTGHVSVSIKDSVYRNVIPGEVKLLVRANAQISPPLVFLMPHAFVDYHVYVTSQGSVKEVPLPSAQFTLVLSKPALASLDKANGHTVTALTLGETEITLVDENLKELAYHRPTSLLHIVAPGYLQFQVFPNRRWVLQVNQTYQISVDVLDHNSHRLHCSANMRIQVSWPREPLQYFDILEEVGNGSWYFVRPKFKGITRLTARMDSIVDHKTKAVQAINPAIEGHQEVEIYDPIQILPSSVILPWCKEYLIPPSSSSKLDDSSTVVKDHLQIFTNTFSKGIFLLKAIGGSGEYLWSVLKSDVVVSSTTDSSVIVTSSGGLIPTALGRSVVMASDVRNDNNWATADVEVVPIHKLLFLPSRREVLIPLDFSTNTKTESVGNAEATILSSDDILIPLALYDSRGRPMATCLYLAKELVSSMAPPLVISTSKSNVIEIIDLIDANDPVMSKITNLYNSTHACLYVRIRGITPDHTELIATFSGLKETTKISIAAYYSALFIVPPSSQTLAVWGSSVEMTVINGPQRWLLDPSGFFYLLQKIDSSKTEQQDWTSAADLLETSEYATTASLNLMAELKPFFSTDSIDFPAMKLLVRCPTWHKQKFGDFDIGFLVGNHITPSNLYPAVSRAKAKLTCSLPKQMRLLPLIPQPSHDNLPPCPLKNGTINNDMPVANSGKLRIEIFFLDDKGHEFDRANSVQITISILESLSSTKKTSKLVANDSPKVIWPKAFSRPFFDIQPLEIGKSLGSFVIKAHASLMDGTHIESHLKLKWSPLAVVKPDNILLFNHPLVSEEFIVQYGSGHFYLPPTTMLSFHSIQDKTTTEETATQGLVYRVHLKNNFETNRPNKPLMVTIYDLCFAALPYKMIDDTMSGDLQHHKSTVSINVVTLSSLDIRVSSLIQVGNSVDGVIVLKNADGNIIPTSLYAKILQSIRFRIQIRRANPLISSSVDEDMWNTSAGDLDSTNSIIEQTEDVSLTKMPLVVPSEDSKSTVTHSISCLRFRVRGIREGVVLLRVSAQHFEGKFNSDSFAPIHSSPKAIEIFTPLKFNPRDLLLLVGTERTLQVDGGPRGNNVIYQDKQSTDASISQESTSVVVHKHFSLELENSSCFKKHRSASSCSQVTMKSTPYSVNDKTAGLVSAISVGAAITVRVQLIGPADPINSTLISIWNSENSKAIDIRQQDKTHGIYSEAFGTIRVVTLTSLRIQSPVNNLLVGESAPLYIIGGSAFGEIDPLSFNQMEPRLIVDWHLSGEQTSQYAPTENTSGQFLPSSANAKLSHLLETFGIRPPKASLFSGIRVTGLSSGQATITANLRLNTFAATASKFPSPFSDGLGDKLTTQIVIRIVEKLNWMFEKRKLQAEILMTPFSGFNLETTLDRKANLVYQLMPSADYSPLKLSKNGYLWAGALHFDQNMSKLVHGHDVVTVHSQFTLNDVTHGSINQTISVSVHVLPVAFIMLHPRHSEKSLFLGKHSTIPPAYLGQGGPYAFEIGFHDYLGRRFHSVSGDLRISSYQNQYEHLESNIKLFRASPAPSDLISKDVGKLKASILQTKVDLTINSGSQNSSNLSKSFYQTTLQLVAEDISSSTKKESGPSVVVGSMQDFVHLPIGQLIQSIAGRSIDSSLQSGIHIGDSMCLRAPFGNCQWRSLNPQILDFYSSQAIGMSDEVVVLALSEGQASIQCSYSNAKNNLQSTFTLGPLTVSKTQQLPNWQPKISDSLIQQHISSNEQTLWFSLFADKPLQLLLQMGTASTSTAYAPECGPKGWSTSSMLENNFLNPFFAENRQNLPFSCHIEAAFHFSELIDSDIWLQNQLPSQMSQLLLSQLYFDETTPSTQSEGSTLFTCFVSWYFHSLESDKGKAGQISSEYAKRLSLSLPSNALLKVSLRPTVNELNDVTNSLSKPIHLRLLGGFQLIKSSPHYTVDWLHRRSLNIYLAVGPSVVAFLKEMKISADNFIKIQFGDSASEYIKMSDGPRRFLNSGSALKENEKNLDISVNSLLTDHLKALSSEAEIWTYQITLTNNVKADQLVNVIIQSPISGQREMLSLKVEKSRSRTTVIADEHIGSPSDVLYDTTSLILFIALIATFVMVIVRLCSWKQSKTVVTENFYTPTRDGNGQRFSPTMSASRSFAYDGGQGSPNLIRNQSPSRTGLWSQGYGFTDPSADFRPMKPDQATSSAYRRNPR